MMRGLERLPKCTRIVDQAVSGVKCLWNVEPREAPTRAFRISALIVAMQARSNILRVPDAVEREFLDHETSDNLCLAGDLQGRLLREQFLLSDEESEELDLLAIERVMHITQPFVCVLVVALRLIAEEKYRAAPHANCCLTDTQREARAFARTRADVRSRITNGFQQIREERTFSVPWLVLALRVVARYLGS